MTYQQQGNSCGAWCAAHRLAIGEDRVLANAATFTAHARSIYARARFNPADANPAWTPRYRSIFANWCNLGYSDPWRIVANLRWSGIQAEIRMAPGAVGVGGQLGEMRDILEGIGTRGVQPPRPGNLADIVPGFYAIGVFQDGPGLHYLLLHNQGGQFRVYDPRSHQLNWRRLSQAVPPFLGTITTRVMVSGVGYQDMAYRFIGVLIRC